MSGIANVYVHAYPNAGFPNAEGVYQESVEVFCEGIRKYAENGLINMVGGCCGTTPEHIKMLKESLKNIPPRVI